MGLLDRWAKKKTVEQLAGETKNDSQEVVVQDSSAKQKKSTGAKKTMSKKDENSVRDNVSTTTHIKGLMYQSIVAPVVSEKSARNEQMGIYTFLVDRKATKNHIRQAFKELYGVSPVRIAVQNVEGKRVRFGRSAGRRADFKKAFVKVPKGSSITVHEGV